MEKETLETTGYVDMQKLEEIIKKAVAKTSKYDLHPEILIHLEELKSRLK